MRVRRGWRWWVEVAPRHSPHVRQLERDGEARNHLALRLPTYAMAVRDDTATDPAGVLPPSPLSEPLLDAEAAAALLAVRPSWIYEAVRTGRVPHMKIGRHVRFLRSDLEGWVLSQRRSARP